MPEFPQFQMGRLCIVLYIDYLRREVSERVDAGGYVSASVMFLVHFSYFLLEIPRYLYADVIPISLLRSPGYKSLWGRQHFRTAYLHMHHQFVELVDSIEPVSTETYVNYEV